MSFVYFRSKKIFGRFFRPWTIALGVAVLCVGGQAAEKTITLPPDNVTLKPGPGMAETSMCMTCHSVDYIAIQPKFPRAKWEAEVTKMRDKYGAPIPTNMVSKIVDYLTVNYGKDDVPTTNAPAAK